MRDHQPYTLAHGDDVFCVLWQLTEGRATTYWATTGDGLFVTVDVGFPHTTRAGVAAILHRAAEYQRRAIREGSCVGPRG